MSKETASVLAVVYAKNMAAVAAFYERTLQLEQVEMEAAHTLLRRGATEVVVIQAPETIASCVVIDRPPSLRETTPFKVSFLVEDFTRVREAAKLTGGALKPEQAAWSWRGFLHLDGSDPEGNIVQFRVPAEAGSRRSPGGT